MTESLLGIPHLVSALCYHLATEDGGNTDEGYIGSRTRDALYRLYKDIAFSCLLGLNEQLPSLADGVHGRDIHSLDSVNKKIKDRALSGRVCELEQRLSVKRQTESSLNRESGCCDLLLPVGFGTVNDVQQTGFVCTEGERVVEFLRCLEGTRITAGEDEENGLHGVSPRGVQDGDHQSCRIQMNRGLFVEDEPSPECIPGVCAGGNGDGLHMEGPPALGWFVDQKKRRVTHRDIDTIRGNGSVNGEQKDSFSWHPSKSPVKVSIGSLFIDHSPGKMTSFEKLETKYDALYRNNGRPEAVERGIEQQNLNSFVPEVSVQQKNKSLWSGEESRISREALLALYGIRASLAKLRGRLVMPEALARPSIAGMLSSFERSATCRVSIESYIHTTLAQDTLDPITYAFANTLKDILHDIDRELVEIEWSGADNWVQPMGMKSTGFQGQCDIKNNKSMPIRGLLFDFEDPIIALPEETDAQGGEFCGLGLSVLQLSHSTSRVQSVLARLFEFLELDGNDEGAISLPSGCRLLEYIYDKSLWIEGDHAALAKRLLLGAFAPYLSVIYKWAFGVRDLDGESSYTGPLSNEYVLYAPSYNGGTKVSKSDAWISHVGPSDIPNFLSNESKRALAVAGTQLRLLYYVSLKIDGVDDVAISLGQMREDLHPGVPFYETCDPKHWFELQNIGKEFDFLNGKVECAVDGSLMVGSERVEDRNGSISTSKQRIVQQWLRNLMQRKSTLGNSRRKQPWKASVKSKETACERVLLNSSLPLSMLLETSIEDLLLIQASMVSRACTSLFIDYLDIFTAVEFARQVFLGFAGDFLSEFVQALEPLVFSLEPLSLHQAKSILFEASTISSLRTSDFAEYLRINLLPGDNALTNVQEAFGVGMEYSDAIRIKAPYYSAMAPVLIPPSGLNAYDCIYVSFEPPWPMGAIFSDETLTAYAAVFNMNLRISRVLFSLKALRRLVSPRDLIRRSMHTEPEYLVWKSRLRVIHSFLFESHRNLDSISQMYKDCCSGASWKRVQHAFDHKSTSDERPETIHDMIDIHRQYIYDAARLILSCCNAPDINQAINSMLTTILDVRNLIEGQMREMKGLEDVISDNDMWRQLKHHIMAYYDQVERLKRNKSEVPVPVSEEEKILYDMLQNM
ncbi:hypothetical protein M9434_003533 [Picochlorum sp. BPE23]|nr:hypothetical protein M9434_003533 [Picochlorum sp. BPE23]